MYVTNQAKLEKFEIKFCYLDVYPMSTDKKELGVVADNQRKYKILNGNKRVCILHPREKFGKNKK